MSRRVGGLNKASNSQNEMRSKPRGVEGSGGRRLYHKEKNAGEKKKYAVCVRKQESCEAGANDGDGRSAEKVVQSSIKMVSKGPCDGPGKGAGRELRSADGKEKLASKIKRTALRKSRG